MQTEAQRIIELAADYLEQFGWKQGSVGYYGGPRCVVGSIASAEIILGKMPNNEPCRVIAWAIEQLHCGMQSVVFWNDAPGQTRSKITRTLYRIAGVEI